MARLHLLLPLFSSLLLAIFITKTQSYSKTIKAPYQKHKPEKLTHLHFYFHDILAGKKPTAVVVATGPTTNTSASSFGRVLVIDDPLTVDQQITSQEVGRAQGMYSLADQNTFGLLMTLNFVFTKGEFSGSSVAMFGRNQVMLKVREMSIIGGTGAFRFGRGYAEAETVLFDNTIAVVEYNVYIWH